jgi:uncharacterized glyoxalase superfamily protein PhnB
MLVNRSVPRCSVMPVLAYPDVEAAVVWLCEAFGFTLRVGMGSHRAQLNVGDCAVVLSEQTETLLQWDLAHSVLVRVEDVNRHYDRAREYGVEIVQAPADYPYGERQYTAKDLVGRRWTFSQSIVDVAPEEWGGVSGVLADPKR